MILSHMTGIGDSSVEEEGDSLRICLEMEQEIVMLMNDLSTPPPNIANSYHQNENETFRYPS